MRSQNIPIFARPEAFPLNPPNKRIGPRHPRLGAAGFRAARWLGARLFAAAGFHQLGSEFADKRIAYVREKLRRGETVYLAGLGPPGTHNSGVALVEVTQAGGPRLIVNNEEERFSGNKHTTEYPRHSIDAMVATLRGIGRDIGDIDAWLTSWDYPTLAGTIARSVLEEVPQSLKLLRTTEAAGFDGRRLDQMTRTPKILGRQLGLAERVPLICLPHHDNHAWFSFAASPFADNREPVAIAVLDGTGDKGSVSLYVVENGAMRQLYCNDSMFNSLGAFYSVISSTQGGWTWLSSEGRYMGAAAWGDMNRASNPYYARLREVLDFGADGEIRLNRAHGQLVLRPVRPSLQVSADRHPRRAAQTRAALESRRGAAGRGHPAPARHPGSARQGRRDATGVRGRHDPCRRPSAARDRREPAGADRRRGAERGRQHAAARAFRRSLVRSSQQRKARLHLWVPPTPGDPGVTIGAAWLFAHLAGAPRGAPMTHAFYCGLPPSSDDIAAALQAADIASQRIGDISTPEGRDAVADLMAFMVARSGIIALYQGAAETGPRALGHRSIFANPCDAQARETAQRAGQIPRGDPPAGADGDAGSGAAIFRAACRAPPTPITTPTITWC